MAIVTNNAIPQQNSKHKTQIYCHILAIFL